MAEGVHLALVVALAPATNSKLGLALGEPAFQNSALTGGVFFARSASRNRDSPGRRAPFHYTNLLAT